MSAPAYRLSTDPERLQLDWITATLRTTYWAGDRSRDTLAAAIRGSRCYGAYDPETGQQVAFARVVTDGVTFAWLCDVIVEPALRGLGIGRWLVGAIVEDPELATVTFHLATRDAHGLYETFGFAREETLRRERRRRPG